MITLGKLQVMKTTTITTKIAAILFSRFCLIVDTGNKQFFDRTTFKISLLSHRTVITVKTCCCRVFPDEEVELPVESADGKERSKNHHHRIGKKDVVFLITIPMFEISKKETDNANTFLNS